MDQLKRMAVFAEVVEHGSMSAAARTLGTTTSAVSQQLRELERSMGVTLLHRSSRKLQLTEAGQRFFSGCATMLAAARSAEQQLAQLRDAPVGELRVASPVGFARHLGPALAPLLSANPGLSLHLQVDDALIDLVDARIDLAVRFGRLPDSSWVAQRLAELELAVCASPAYLARRGVPTLPADLAHHEWLRVDARPGLAALELTGPQGVVERLRPATRVTSNNQLSLQQLCEAGIGLAVLALQDIEASLVSGALVPLLPEWRLAPLPMYVVTPRRDTQPAKVRHAIAAVQAYLQGLRSGPSARAAWRPPAAPMASGSIAA
ncbi:LysR family transcriptional regulator [Caldimonas brevitalea]|uniref:LysR family transcriptional regulator n=1 Tax=Caldimonas brevitalea TaxID=413882 RepID=UPI00063FE514|nr:LysR family transcriptional regulator [Caldimonas brevitalea]